MAEYYPLISRAVAGLRDGAPEPRQAIYGRAKQALIAQLRGMQPPIPEADIDREVTALDEAVTRIETEIAARKAEPAKPEQAAPKTPAAPPPPVSTAPSPPPPPVPPPPAALAAAPLQKPSSARPVAPATTGAPAGTAPRPERPLFTPRASLPPRPSTTQALRPVVQRPSIDTIPEAPPPPAPATPSAPATPAAEPQPPAQAEPPKPALPAAPTLDVAALAPEPTGGHAPTPVLEARFEPSRSFDDAVASKAPHIEPLESRARDEAIRPAVPGPTITKPRNLRVWIVSVVALAAIIAIALTAWKLRDRPEELARIPVATPQPEAPSKIVERADGGAPADTDSTDDSAPAANTSAPAPVSAPTPAAAPAAPQPAGDQAIPVSYKAAVLVDAPDTPEKVKTYVGSVVWRTESVSQGQDQPLGTAVRADVDIPDAKIQLVMELRKNTEAQFPASHTIDLKFTIAADSPVGGVKQINVPQMRREDMPTGDPLMGVPVSITGNYFLVGLTRGDAEARNLEAIRTRGWFDIPMLLDNGKPAKITFEKGASGERIINDAIQVWNKP